MSDLFALKLTPSRATSWEGPAQARAHADTSRTGRRRALPPASKKAQVAPTLQLGAATRHNADLILALRARIRTAQNFGAVLPKVERRSIRALNSAQFLGFVEKTAEFVASFNRNNPGK